MHDLDPSRVASQHHPLLPRTQQKQSQSNKSFSRSPKGLTSRAISALLIRVFKRWIGRFHKYHQTLSSRVGEIR